MILLDEINLEINFSLNKNLGFKNFKWTNDFLNGDRDKLPTKVEMTVTRYYKHF